MDSLFGFSYHGAVRKPYQEAMLVLSEFADRVVSVDLPSAWAVDEYPVSYHTTPWTPAAVISLTTPKVCMTSFSGRHYLGGRYGTIRTSVSGVWKTL